MVNIQVLDIPFTLSLPQDAALLQARIP
jgi:hypothetical protein